MSVISKYGDRMLERDIAETEVRHNDPLLWLIPLILTGIGILMITSTTSTSSFLKNGMPYSTGMSQLGYFLFGLVCMLLEFAVPAEKQRALSGLFLIVSFVAVALTFTGLGVSVGGARRWLWLRVFNVQPSEMLSLAVMLSAAKIADRCADDGVRCAKQFMILGVLCASILLMQPDLGSTLLVFGLLMGIYAERFGWGGPVCATLVLGFLTAVLILVTPYRMRRFLAFWDPWADPYGKGYQTIQGLIASANGGLWGTGLGHGFQKLNYLPAANTDFIWSALGEELGLVGALCVLVLCLVWVTRCRVLYRDTRTSFNATCAWGIALSVTLQMFINIAGVTRTMPMTGMPLPFISYGGSSLVIMWVRVGLLLRIQKENRE